MKLIAIIAASATLMSGYSEAKGSHPTRGYVKRNGTVVASSHATNPNATKRDNFTTQGNVNPYTGKPGTKRADNAPAPSRPPQ